MFHTFAERDSEDTKLATVGSSITRQRAAPNVVEIADLVLKLYILEEGYPVCNLRVTLCNIGLTRIVYIATITIQSSSYFYNFENNHVIMVPPQQVFFHQNKCILPYLSRYYWRDIPELHCMVEH